MNRHALEKAHYQSLQEAIRTVLLYDWDPIGIGNEPGWPRDEYDSYIGGIAGLLLNGATDIQIALHLMEIANHRMGFASKLEDHFPAVKALRKIPLK